ncbi:hypothetical protein BGX23_002781, partial [Mortierella sp. AD031]
PAPAPLLSLRTIPTFNMDPPCIQVFSIPELLFFVRVHLTKRDLLRLMRVSRVFNAIFLPTLYYEVDLRNSSVVLASRIAAQSLARSAPYIRKITVDEHFLMVYSKGVIGFKDTEDQDTDKACNNKVEGGL